MGFETKPQRKELLTHIETYQTEGVPQEKLVSLLDKAAAKAAGVSLSPPPPTATDFFVWCVEHIK